MTRSPSLPEIGPVGESEMLMRNAGRYRACRERLNSGGSAHLYTITGISGLHFDLMNY